MAIRAKITQITLGVHLRVAMVWAGMPIGVVSKTMQIMAKLFSFARNAAAVMVRRIVLKVYLCFLSIIEIF